LTSTAPDAGWQLDRFDIEAADSVDCAQPRSHRPLGVVLMRLRVTEIDQYAVAHVAGDEAIEPSDNLHDGAVISGDDLSQILGIEPRRQRHRADKIAEHHRELPSLGSLHSRGPLLPLQHRVHCAILRRGNGGI
jgi:hypothetical protein